MKKHLSLEINSIIDEIMESHRNIEKLLQKLDKCENINGQILTLKLNDIVEDTKLLYEYYTKAIRKYIKIYYNIDND